LVSTFHSFFGGPFSTTYTVVLLLFSGMALVLGDARVEMECEFAEEEKQNFGVLVADAFSSEAVVARFAAGHRLDR
jgi:hypothetical protein